MQIRWGAPHGRCRKDACACTWEVLVSIMQLHLMHLMDGCDTYRAPKPSSSQLLGTGMPAQLESLNAVE